MGAARREQSRPVPARPCRRRPALSAVPGKRGADRRPQDEDLRSSAACPARRGDRRRRVGAQLPRRHGDARASAGAGLRAFGTRPRGRHGGERRGAPRRHGSGRARARRRGGLRRRRLYRQSHGGGPAPRLPQASGPHHGGGRVVSLGLRHRLLLADSPGAAAQGPARAHSLGHGRHRAGCHRAREQRGRRDLRHGRQREQTRPAARAGRPGGLRFPQRRLVRRADEGDRRPGRRCRAELARRPPRLALPARR